MREHFRLEATARCHLDCRHCAIRLPEGDKDSRKLELSAAEISRLAGEAAALGFRRCLITGGEPFLRKDFFDVYQAVLSKGLLVSVSTSATLVTDEHVRFLKKFPSGPIVISVFGASRETYERVTRTPGSFDAFRKGLDRLLASGLTLRIKVRAMRSNKHEINAMADLGWALAKSPFEIDPFLDLRYDRDEARNVTIRAERLSPKEIVRLERTGPETLGPVAGACPLRRPQKPLAVGTPAESSQLFRCEAGLDGPVIGPFGAMRPCPPLHHPDFLVNLRKVGLAGALDRLFPMALARETKGRELVDACRPCPIGNFCSWCPALAYLETGRLDLPVESLCQLAAARAEGLS